MLMLIMLKNTIPRNFTSTVSCVNSQFILMIKIKKKYKRKLIKKKINIKIK